MLSVLIPTWRNPDYLKNCIASLLKNTYHPIEIIVYLNEDCVESRSYLEHLDLPYLTILSSPQNQGICVALNESAQQANGDYLVYLNDDMYVLPHWDRPIIECISTRTDDLFLYSGTMIEPHPGTAPTVVADFGRDIESFEADRLERSAKKLTMPDWSGAAWPPSIVSRRLWELVGGYDLAYSPGYYSDPDFAMKLYQEGVRDFRGLGDCLVYHFSKVSTSRLPQSSGRQIFFCKWKLSSSTFYKYILRMGQPYDGPLKAAKIPLPERLKNLWKRLTYKCKN